MSMRKYLVVAQWDEEAGVWVATSDDIPGLVSEAKTIDDLVKRVVAVAPELLEDNAHLMNKKDEMSDLLEVCVQSTFSMHAAAPH